MKFSTLRKLLASLLLAGLVSLAAAQGDGFNVAAGKQVQASRAAAEGYPDSDGLKLTDGSYEFAWGDMVGWEGPESLSLVVDLGAVYDAISYVSLRAMRSDGSAVSLPAYVIVSVSEDGVLYEDLGMALQFLEGDVANDTIGTLVWADEDWAGYGQYIKVDVRPGGEAWTMLAELTVGNGPVAADLVPATTEAEGTTAAPVTVSIGSTYTLVPEAAVAYPDDEGTKLTDGSYEYSWADMVGIMDPVFNPVVVLDLGERVEGITRVSGQFMRSFASAVNLPYSLVVSVSDDGVDFTPVGLAVRTVPEFVTNEYINSFYWQDLVNPVDGRFVRVEVRARTGWTMLAEVTVQTGAAVAEVEEPEQ